MTNLTNKQRKEFLDAIKAIGEIQAKIVSTSFILAKEFEKIEKLIEAAKPENNE